MLIPFLTLGGGVAGRTGGRLWGEAEKEIMRRGAENRKSCERFWYTLFENIFVATEPFVLKQKGKRERCER